MTVVELIKDHLPVQAPFQFSKDVLLLENPSCEAAEDIRLASTRLLAREAEMGLGAVAVCGGASGAGTTFVAVNLAHALASAGRRVLLVDANLRDPQLQRFITPLRPVNGLCQVLEGDASAEETVQQDVLENLSVLFSGGQSAQSFRLLAKPQFTHLLAQSLDDYDVVLLDTPPVRMVADGRHVAAVAGNAIGVARKDHTLVSELHSLVDDLRSGGADVLGVLLNGYGA